MPSTEYLDDYAYNNDHYDNNEFDDDSQESFRRMGKMRKKNKVHIGKCEEDDDYIYSSKGTGSFICNARSGYKTDFRVGTREEDYFFSVIDSSSRNKDKTPFVFFFDTPEQYERIMRIHYPNFTLSKKTIQDWHKKQMTRLNS